MVIDEIDVGVGNDELMRAEWMLLADVGDGW